MGPTRVFLPQQALNAWLADGRVQLAAGRLTTEPEGRSYRVAEAVRMVGEVAGGSDRYELVGKVKPLDFVRELGAELLGDSMVLEDSAYDVVYGWVVMPGSTGALGRNNDRGRAGQAGDQPFYSRQSDAEALAQFLARNL